MDRGGPDGSARDDASTRQGATAERRLSIRLVWPFVRIVGVTRAGLEILTREHIGPAEFVNPDTRIRHRAVMELLERTVESTGDPGLGLRAGERLAAGDFGALENAALSCKDLRTAIDCGSRYVRLMNEAAEVELTERGDEALWSFHTNDGVPQPPAANEFVLSAVLRFVRLHTGIDEPPSEAHFAHEAATDTKACERIFDCPLRFGAPHNAIKFPRARLDLRMPTANPSFRLAFSHYAEELLRRIPQSIPGRVREVVIEELRGGGLNMRAVARRLAMSVPTLRRRLDEEGSSYSEVVNRVRRELAEQYLHDRRVGIAEIASLLGFGDVAAFCKAFRRWTGVTPARRRAELRGE
jgi:AraC-like DNA-binding protein